MFACNGTNMVVLGFVELILFAMVEYPSPSNSLKVVYPSMVAQLVK
jgi:hypothetical protein